MTASEHREYLLDADITRIYPMSPHYSPCTISLLAGLNSSALYGHGSIVLYMS